MVKPVILSVLVILPVTAVVFTKCCPPDQVLDLDKNICIYSNHGVPNTFTANITHHQWGTEKNMENLKYDFYAHEILECEKYMRCSQFSFYKDKFEYWIQNEEITTFPYPVSDACIDEGLDTETGKISVVAHICTACSLLWCSDPIIPPGVAWGWNDTIGDFSVDGTVWYEVANISGYCIETGEEGEETLLLCPVTNDHVGNTVVIIRRVWSALSFASILAIIIIHLVIQDLRILNFTKLKIPFWVCLFFTNVSFVLREETNLCATESYSVFLGLAFQYFYLGMYFWLTSMSLDIWLTFRRIVNPLQNRGNKDAVLSYRMKGYYLFSLGGPGIISLVTGVLQFVSTQEKAEYIHPNFQTACWIGLSRIGNILYFQLYTLSLLFINAIFYSLMVLNFTCGIWKSNFFGKQQMRNLTVLLELLFLMGIAWIPQVNSIYFYLIPRRNWNKTIDETIYCIFRLTGVFSLLDFLSKSSNRSLLKNRLIFPLQPSQKDPLNSL